MRVEHHPSWGRGGCRQIGSLAGSLGIPRTLVVPSTWSLVAAGLFLVRRPRLRARGGAAVAFGRRVAPFYLSCPPRALAAWPYRRSVGVAAGSGPGHSAPPAQQLEPFPPLQVWRAGACRTPSPWSSRRRGAAENLLPALAAALRSACGRWAFFFSPVLVCRRS